MLIADKCRSCSPDQIFVPYEFLISTLSPSGDNVQATWRQVECNPPGSIVVDVDQYRATLGGYIRVAFLNVAGSGAIETVELKGSNDNNWQEMENSFGARWELSILPDAPLDLRITTSDGEVVEMPRAITRGGATGRFETSAQVGGAAAMAVAPSPELTPPSREFPPPSPEPVLIVAEPPSPELSPPSREFPPPSPEPVSIVAEPPLPELFPPSREFPPPSPEPVLIVAEPPLPELSPVVTEPAPAPEEEQVAATSPPPAEPTPEEETSVAPTTETCENNVLDVLESAPELSNTLSVIDPNLSAVLQDANSAVTIFAPVNSAWQDISPTRRQEIISGLIRVGPVPVNPRATPNEQGEIVVEVQMYNGDTLEVVGLNDGFLVRGPSGNEAQVTRTERACNGAVNFISELPS